MTVLERLARVLCVEDRINPDGAVLVGMETMRAWKARMPKVRAVLTALREPSEGMIEAMKNARHGVPEGSPHGIVFNHAWQAAIDTILSETE